MGLTLYLLAAVGGAVAGFMSTLAGLGSVITLYILIDILHLDPNIANGTNRLGILAMCLMALPAFHRNGHLDLYKNKEIILTLFVGAIGGVILALNIDNNDFKEIYKYLLFVMLALVLLNPKRWAQDTDSSHQLNWWIAFPAFLLMGFYAGFIQLGTGVFFVVFLALMGKYSLVDANGVKLAAFALYTFVVIILFAINGRIDWGVGLALAFGQGIGGLIAARFATTYPKANVFVRYLLIFVIIVAIIRLFELYEWLRL